jgi:polyhydroxybutyrate depolymerase
MDIMRMQVRFPASVVVLLLSLLFMRPVQGAGIDGLPPGFQNLEFAVDGVVREALIYAPATARTTSTPVVFVFHGHGGNALQAAHGFAIDQHWPDAISVYMQGLKTPGRLTDPSGNEPGWQAATGDQGNRDLRFFDAVLARLKQDYRVDEKRIYATGHSNGGGFTYLLWAERGRVFAAVAPSAAAARYVDMLTPKPALLLAGEQDPLVKFAWQKRMMEAVRKINGCDSDGQPWDKQCTIYPSKTGTPIVTFIHPGGHEFDRNAPALIVKFFKEHPASGK